MQFNKTFIYTIHFCTIQLNNIQSVSTTKYIPSFIFQMMTRNENMNNEKNDRKLSKST